MQITSSARLLDMRWGLSWVGNTMWISANWWGIQPQRCIYLYTIQTWLYIWLIYKWYPLLVSILLTHDDAIWCIMAQWLVIFQQNIHLISMYILDGIQSPSVLKHTFTSNLLLKHSSYHRERVESIQTHTYTMESCDGDVLEVSNIYIISLIAFWLNVRT